MRVTAKVDYAMRAMIELGAAPPDGPPAPVKGAALSRSQSIPRKFLESILTDLRHAGLVASQRGADGGYRLARPAETITVAEVIRAVEGPLAAVQGERPENLSYRGSAEPLQLLWICVRAGLRRVLERVTIADLVAGRFDPEVAALANDPGAWDPH